MKKTKTKIARAEFNNSAKHNKPKKFDARKHWKGMPEFVQNNVGAFKKITVNFANENDVREFFKRINQTYTPKTRSIWFPDAGIDKLQDKRYASKK